MQDATPITVLAYQDQQGREPFTEWLNSLSDQKTRRAILRRIGKVEQGLFGD